VNKAEAVQWAVRYSRERSKGKRFAACPSCGQDLRLPPLSALEMLEALEALSGEDLGASKIVNEPVAKGRRRRRARRS